MIKQASHDNRRKNFASITAVVDYPDLLDIQLESFKNFFQLETSNEKKKLEGLYKVFKENFPVSDTRENFVLEFIDYALDAPKYSQEECISRGVTSAIPLKVKLRLSCNDKNNEDFQTIEQEVFLGTIPYMTTKGSFIINGIERVVVAQLHKSPGAFFLKSKHTSGVILYSVRVIPFKGAWMEFSTDINNVMYVYIDRKKKFPVTTLLRAIGYDTDKEILDIFGLSEEVPANKKILKQKIGRTLGARVLKTWVEDFVDEDTGEVISVDRHEVLLERAIILDEETIEIILKSGVKFVILQRSDINILDYSIIYNTLQKDNANSEKEATEQIYRQLRNADPPDERTARETVQGLFFSNRRYDLGEVGRYKINKKLGTNISFDVRVLTQEDIIEIVKHLIQLINAKAVVDDIDHLSNRRVKVVGEQLYAQFGVGISRMVRTIKERMNVRDNENFKPADLVNPRILSSVINSFFGTNPLSQFMDQVNPLAEVTHKRRLSSLGPGGLSKDRAGFEVRDVHYTHYGRLCTVETPEGPNIGLISSLCVYAKINNMGFIETPYKKVKKGQINMSRHVDYLTAEEEDSCNIVQANVALDKQGKFINNKVKVRFEGDFPFVLPEDINYMDVGPNQIAGVAASLIPFLEHDDANRVLMGSNMQRQAVPLLQPDSPIVGTGLERHIAKDFRGLVCAEKNGVIEYVDATKIVVQYQLSQEEEFISFEKSVKTYNLLKFKGTNHYTCINLRPIVLKGDKVKKGQVLCEGYATQNGELALGKNLQVAFMPWRGYNFEDAIVISEKIVQQDIFTSVHIEKFELEIRDTKLGEEEFTAEIPNVSEEAVKNLDENGIIRVGAEVKEGDILIGKITPKVKSDATPEEKFLRAIFGDKAGDVKNVSLHMPSSTTGVVIDVRLFSKSQKNKQIRVQIKKELEALKKYYSTKLLSLRTEMIKKLSDLLQGENSMGIYHKFGDILIEKKIALTAQVIETKLFSHKNIYSDETHYHIPEEVNLIADVVLDHWTANESKNRILKVLVKNYNKRRNHILGNFKKEKFVLEVGDELPTGILKLANVYVAKKKKLQVGDKMSGRHGNKGVVAKIVAEADMPFLPDGTRVDLVLNPLGVAARMNLGQIYETVLGWAGLKLGKKYATPIFNGASVEDVAQELAKAGLPKFGKTQLYDGLTGEKFDQKVTVGVIYMLKLNHLVDDKMHARSIGPYSLITQQPLGGKSQFGGQRFGEMEVWSLEAFGAAHTLQEMLTIKSDDIVGRGRAYAAIVKGENIPKPNPPESFKVLVHELRGLGLEITYS